jgi:hypothetical protein
MRFTLFVSRLGSCHATGHDQNRDRDAKCDPPSASKDEERGMTIKGRAAATVGAVALTLGAMAAIAAPAYAATYVAGSVACVTGNAVEGVFVNANSGGGGWGIMNVPGGTSNAVSWHYTLPKGGSYYVAVGCGGRPSSWNSTSYSGNYTGNSSSLICYDTRYEVPAGWQYRCR